jgi:carotenoid cleavage dioxygenase-like enzyme
MSEPLPVLDPDAPFGRDLSPMIEGLYAPVFEENVFTAMTVIGEVPRDLNGVYLRNGPNPRFRPQGRYHWFDGDGMMHAAHFENGRVTYRNKWLRTDAFAAETLARRATYWGVMETHKDRTDRPMKDSANTDVIGHAGVAVASWYLGGTPYFVHPLTLETLGKAEFARGLHGGFSAHCKVDQHTGELLFFDYWNEAPYMTYGVVGPDGRLKHHVPIELPGPRLPHDMAVSEHYSILHDLPLFHDLEALKMGRHKISFYPEMPARFGVIPRYGAADSIRWFEASPCFVYHVVNASEEGDEVVMVACRYMPPKDAKGAIDASKMAKMIASLQMDARLYRWRFNLRTGQTKEEMIDPDRNLEFPSIDNGRTGRRARFAYTMQQTMSHPDFTGIAKHDLDTGACESFSDGPGFSYSESPFASRDHAVAEDDGYLVSFVWNGNERRSELQVFDAKEVKRGPVARVVIPARVPMGFHATWMGAGQIAT